MGCCCSSDMSCNYETPTIRIMFELNGIGANVDWYAVPRVGEIVTAKNLRGVVKAVEWFDETPELTPWVEIDLAPVPGGSKTE